MKRRRLAVLGVLLLVVAVPGYPRAATSRRAATFAGLIVQVAPDDEIGFDCAVTGARSTNTQFFAFAIEDAAGNGYFYMDATRASGDVAFTVKTPAASEDRTVVSLPGGFARDSQVLGGRRPATTATLRAAWASWDSHIACVATKNGARLASPALPADGAAVASLTDFDAPLAATTAASQEAATAGALASLGARANGYVFCIFEAGDLRGAGSIAADGPHGEHYASMGPFLLLAVNKKSAGDWTFSDTLSAANASGPVLWFMTLPR
jgi:hypothetical protein